MNLRRKKNIHQILRSMWKFELQCLLDNLVDLSIFINACLPQIYYLMAVDYREPGQEKKNFCYMLFKWCKYIVFSSKLLPMT